MMRALAAIVVLLAGCVLDRSLGDHSPIQASSARPRERDATTVTEPPDSALPAAMIGDPHASDAAGASEAEPHSPVVSEPEHDSAVVPEPHADARTAQPPPAEPPPAETAPQEPPPAHDTPVDAGPDHTGPVCDMATDNACLQCDQATCCEQRLACLGREACACHMECRTAAEPAACHETCGAMTDYYQPWVTCLHDHCAEHCTL
jgi:hypothetical protein